MTSTTLAFPDDPLKEKLLGLLAAGVSQTGAALATACSVGYVSQLLEDPDFAAALGERKSVRVEAAIKHDDTIEAIEVKALKVIDSKLPFVRNPLEAARIFQILNSAKKRAVVGTDTPQALGAQIVSIILPKAAAVQINMNSLNQVTEVQGRSMATLPSRSLPSLAADVKVKKVELAKADEQRADELLSAMEVHTTKIGGVVAVL